MALRKEEKEQIVNEFGQSPTDTGSAEVQVAMLTKRIRELTEHCKVNQHDFSSKRGLLKMVCQRRKFLRYLENSDVDKYKKIIDRLGLRK